MIDGLTIHHLRFTIEAATPITPPPEPGSAIRGALVSALREHYCPDASLRPSSSRVEADPAHRAICPVCWLIAGEDASGERGRNVQRPYTIEPWLSGAERIQPGEKLSFGISLVGQAINLFPYVVLAIPETGRRGLGRFDPRDGGRGRFVLRAVTAINPLSGARQPLLADGARLQLPAVPVEAAQVGELARRLADRAHANEDRLELRFLTPTRIVDGAHLVRRAAFGPLFRRLVERIEGLAHYYASGTSSDRVAVGPEILEAADRVEIVDDQTRWTEVMSGSRRLGRATPVSGYRGRVVYRAEDWLPLLPWLIWGQSVHVGKSAVKGNGWFTIEGCPGWTDLDEATNVEQTQDRLAEFGGPVGTARAFVPRGSPNGVVRVPGSGGAPWIEWWSTARFTARVVRLSWLEHRRSAMRISTTGFVARRR